MIIPDQGVAHTRPIPPSPPHDEHDAHPAEATVHDELLRSPAPPPEAKQLARHQPPQHDTRDVLARLAQPGPLPEPDTGDGGLGTLRDLMGHAHDAADAIERALRQIAREQDPAPAPAAPVAPPLPPAAQGQADAAVVQQVYDDTLARTGNAAEAAQSASGKLNELTSAHAGDAVYTTALLRAAQPTLDRIGAVLGDHVNGKYNGNDADKAAIVDTVRNLSVAAGNAGELGALIIASNIAPHIPDKGDLRKLDDAFYEHIEAGGSAALFGALYQQLKAEGKNTAAEELKDKHGGLLDWVRDRIDDAIDLAGKVAGAVVGGVASVVKDGIGLAVDIAKGTVDVVGDVAQGAEAAVRFAVENGLKVGGKLLEFVIDTYRKGLDSALDIGEHIDDLEVGDTYALGLDVEVAIEVGVEVGRDVSVTRTDNGYEVSGHFGANVDIENIAGGKVGGDGTITFHADTAAEAKQLALMLASGPKPSELGFARDHLQSIELGASAALEGELYKLGVGNIQSALEGQVGVQESYRIEFEDGKPVALVRTATLSAEGSASGDRRIEGEQAARVRALAAELGIDLPDSYAANAQLEVSLETRIPIDGARASVGQLLSGDFGGALKTGAGAVTHSLTVSGSIEGAGDDGVYRGVQFEATLSDIGLDDAAAVAKALASGDPRALRDIDVDFAGWWATTRRSDELPLDLNIIVAGAGISVEASSGTTDVDWEDRHALG